MTSTNEPRALSAALSSPAFVTRGGGLAMHVANKHVSRWAPEVGEPGMSRTSPLRNLGFVDRLVSPWIESAQRSASMRMFSQYISNGAGERQASNVSWVFPRPWYQDELDWMAAARAVNTQMPVEQGASPQMFTTRGTYVAPQQQIRDSQIALPSALYEYVAPSLSIARPEIGGVSDAYSPLVPLAATHAAQVMARAMAPIMAQPSLGTASAAARMSPGLRAVLSTMLERSAQPQQGEYGMPSRVSSFAPELVTPPSPRADVPASVSTPASSESYEQATLVAEQYAEQRVRINELQRVARVAAEREYVARAEQSARQADPSRVAEIRAAETRAVEARQVELQQRAGEVAAQRSTAAVENQRVREQAQQAQIEERVQRIVQQQEAQRLHSSSRDAAARDARVAPSPMPAVEAPAPVRTESRMAADVAAAISSLPPELAAMVTGSIGSRPDRAVQAIAELSDALRAVELMARNTASGRSFESTRGPRLVMPTGLGGLVATVDRTSASTQGPMAAASRMPMTPMMPMMPTGQPAPRMMAQRTEMRVPAMSFLAAPGTQSGTQNATAPTSALGAAASITPAALSHVAWSDRWLARFAGAKTSSLDMLSVMSASPEMRYEMLAAAAPQSVFVAPFSDDVSPVQPVAYADGTPIARPGSVAADVLPTLRNAQPQQAALRIADDAETPDDVLFAIATATQMRRPLPAGAVPAAPVQPQMTFERDSLADLVAHAAPSAPGAGLSAGLASSPYASALRHVLPLGSAPTFDVRALFGGGLGATYLAGLLASSTDELAVPAAAMPSWATWAESASTMLGGGMAERDVAGFEPTYVSPESGESGDRAEAPADITAMAEATAMAEQVTTMRSALLSWDVESVVGAPAYDARMSAPSVAMGPTLARSMIEAMTMPMLSETAAIGDHNVVDYAGAQMHASSYASPGMIADRAMGWSIAQERSTADLAFDFVTPELVLAARVYGLGPAEAAQAARLAISGPGQLSAMAGTVDRTFVQALAIDAERRGGGRASLTTAYPTTTDMTGVAGTPRAGDAPTYTQYSAAYSPSDTEGAPARSLFGVERRAPRGAFLWPAATTAALGLTAAAPDGEMSMSVVALELLAAQAVAELGTYAALGERGISIGPDGVFTSSGPMGATGGAGAAPGADAIEADVLASAESMVPQARREKFSALYIAMSESSQGRTWSPAARAARALALASRGDESLSARERASIAWDVLPVVHGMSAEGDDSNLSTGDVVTRNMRRRDELRALDPVFVDGRPGLSTLSSRAGEALGSYVTPSGGASGSSSSGSSSREQGAVMRAPSAAQELVQTGRPSGRHGGGEVEIPAWFEEAARKMLADRSSASDGISLADLTLVQAAAPQQIAASSRHAGGASSPVAPATSGAAGAEKESVDIEKLANDVYREIMIMMDVARARNGEPL